MHEEILKGFFFIERGFLNGNHFLFKGEKPVLVDTGYIGDFSRTRELLEGLGVDLSSVELIVNTHTHCDHIGGNALIQEISGCGIALHAFGKHFIDSRDDWSTWWRYYNQEARFFECTQEIADGDTVPIGPHEFKAIHAPGHASDGLVLYHPPSKILLSSDTLWEEDMAVMTLRVEGSAALFAHEESLEKISRLEVTRVFPGHGRPFSDCGKAVAKAKERVGTYFRERERIGQDLLKRIFIYTLLMRPGVDVNLFFGNLMKTHWFRETVDLYFGSEYELKYDEIMDYLIKKRLVVLTNGFLSSTVKP
ncbi:MAG: MBL fold metallo-hydrolase [Desulfobacteraceae bacterium]|nr:MAG: MBL fold metallo-hydrolase [Desulfobacteraceae bacterium]